MRQAKQKSAELGTPRHPAVFPPIAIDPGAYKRALVKSADDPIQTRLIEVGWLGTVQYQACIQRDGYAVQAQVLGWIRGEIAAVEKDLAGLARMEAEEAARLLNLRRQRSDTADSMIRRPSYGAEKVVESLDKRIAFITDWQPKAKEARERITGRILPSLRLAEARLEAALRYFLDHPPEKRSEAPPAPQVHIVNEVRVEPTPISMEATINAPPAEVTVSLPARRTETTIERDAHGNITHASQLETDAA